LSPLAQAVLERHDWVLPKIEDILEVGADLAFDDEYDRQRAQLIEETLTSFGAPAHVVEINRGPTITQYGVEPDFIENRSGRTRVRVSKIASLADDLSLALAAQRIRIQAPVPGKGYVGIEVPNDEISVVALRDVIESAAYRRLRSPLRFALGQDVAGNAVAADLAGMPHLLVAGATGSGKSVCVNAIITCMMLQNTPDTLRFIMVDPKRVELTGYNGIPHLLAPVVTDIERVVGVLQWVTREMDSRYQKFADSGARNIADFNKRAAAEGKARLPFLVLVIDELADMMMVAPDQTERLITRMAQLARATGIHLIISTQRPSVDVVTGLIKANFPARISFAVASGTDSRVIIDQPGAERLLGRGDMLFQAPDAPTPVRLQGVFVSDGEILRAVQYWRAFAGTSAMAPVPTGAPTDAPPSGIPLKQKAIWEEMEEQEEQDPIYPEAVELVRKRKRASISMLQRRLRIGYTRAARMIEQMEEEGIIGPATEGSKPREVLDYGDNDLNPAKEK
jgi:S-DNA-T family DNA segregation ATPase FtsK/SpoIIIE